MNPVVLVKVVSERVAALGASACLKKPVDRNILLAAIETATVSTSKK